MRGVGVTFEKLKPRTGWGAAGPLVSSIAIWLFRIEFWSYQRGVVSDDASTMVRIGKEMRVLWVVLSTV